MKGYVLNGAEAEAYVAGWDTCVRLHGREVNPYTKPFASALDRDRHRAWDRGWLACAEHRTFKDPRIRRGVTA